MKTTKMTKIHNVPKIENNCVNDMVAKSSKTQNCDILRDPE